MGPNLDVDSTERLLDQSSSPKRMEPLSGMLEHQYGGSVLDVRYTRAQAQVPGPTAQGAARAVCDTAWDGWVVPI